MCEVMARNCFINHNINLVYRTSRHSGNNKKMISIDGLLLICISVPLTRGFVHYFIKSFIRSFLHPRKRDASFVPTIQMRKLSLGEVKRFAWLTS